MSPSGQNRPLPALFGWRSRLAIIVAGLLLLSWGGPAASAFWGSISSGPAAAKADSLAQGARPAASISGANVTVSWTASTTAAGRPVTGYSIARYSSATAGTRIPATGACAGTVAALSCVESAVPAGTWYYTVTPTLSLWQGTESQRSTATTPVTDTTPPLAPVVTAPGSVNQGNVSSVPVSGTAEANSTVVLTITGGGAQAVTQTITTDAAGNWTAVPVNLGAFSPGTITFSAKATDAAGNTGPAGTATATKDVSSPTITGVQLNNGAGKTPGVVEQGDSVTLTFSEALSANTICSAWTSNTATQTQNGNGSSQVLVNISAGDVLTVTQAGCPSLRVGSVALGGDYTASALTFAGNNTNGSTLTWNPGAKTLTITLGAGGPGALTVAATPTPLPGYAPASGLTDIAGNPLPTTQVNSLAASRF
ncbi:hypothetical protein J2790_004124 [Paenarthrobacter nicotinovorans]|uniref:Ig-like domain-containing protein n=1 Tax=Micrococcaceae TaxID=1268 RepID=UPI000876F3F0|nr:MULTISPECIES: Ig-like domain-containing protein [Micrococcaceae]MDR6438949.1 hypothetical protein [Paenarthrobacter nicotinovorans]SCZ66773.1 hypothetical protein SAMN02799638_04468 [Arthrobacter sp. UNCCL28]